MKKPTKKQHSSATAKAGVPNVAADAKNGKVTMPPPKKGRTAGA